MKINIIEGNHLTATERKHLPQIFENFPELKNKDVRISAKANRKVYNIQNLGDNLFSVKIVSRYSGGYGEPVKDHYVNFKLQITF